MRFLLVTWMASATVLNAQPVATRSPVILVVAAHPDDEIMVAPALLHYTRAGARVFLAYATDGAHGVRQHAAIPAGDSLARVRTSEARCAADRLGAQPPVLLGFRDGIATGSLDTMWREMSQLRDSLAAVVARLRPTTILTWGPDGGTGHPDHRLVSAIITELYQRDRLGGVDGLYYVGWPAQRASQARAAPGRSLPGTREELLGFQVAVDETDWNRADAAFRCHRSQFTAEEMRDFGGALRQVNGDRIYFRRAADSDPARSNAEAPRTQDTASVTRWFAGINRDIWTPFLEGVRNDDESLYLRVRSRDYVRVQGNGRLMLTYDDYVDDTRQMMRRYREQGTRLAIDVRFEERIIDGATASEKGISRVLFTMKDGVTRTYYSRFHTISRKEGDVWRVLSEYFPATTDDVGEREFARARTLDDVTEFRCYTRYPDKRLRC